MRENIRSRNSRNNSRSNSRSKKSGIRRRTGSRNRTLAWLIGIPVVVLVLIAVIIVSEPERDGISRAAACKAAALTMTTAEECREQAREAVSYFPEKTKNQWYAKYMDYLYRQELLSTDMVPAEAKTAEGWLTYEEAGELASRMSESLGSLVKVTKGNRKKHFPKDQWWLLYDEMRKVMDTEGAVERKNILVYGTPLNVDGAAAWTAYTSEGTLGFEGLSLDSYIDSEIAVLMRGKELIRVESLVSEEVVYRNIWLKSATEKTLEGYVGTITRQFDLKKALKKPEEMGNMVADLHLSGGKVKKVVLKKEKITGKVLEVKDDSIEIEGYGAVPLDENFYVYKLYGEFRQQQKSDILVGYDIQEFVVADGKLCAALSVRQFDAETIRVLVMDTGFHSLFHDSITLMPESGATLIIDEKETKVSAGESITFAMDDKRLDSGRIFLKSSDELRGIAVNSIERAQGTPVYPGRLEVKREEEGLVLVNELYLEDYLKRVVPSEMPASYATEALKAQAVCARTYAYRQIRGNSYRQYGAHVDDSTRFQVYNNVMTDTNTDTAVNETYGKLLQYEGAVLEAYYFSTSCGVTTDGTIWGADLSTVPYLQSVSVSEKEIDLDLTSNVVFADFIKNTSYPSYESGYALYRWRTTITSRQLEQKVNDIGTITKVTMKERGAGGIGKTMEIEGTEGVKTISGQGQIRSILGNPELVITKNDGKTMTGSDTIPSAFIAIERGEPDAEQVTTFTIYGGGYGHGVGMSQNGAQGMAKNGMNYKDILTSFFSGAVVEEIGANENNG